MTDHGNDTVAVRDGLLFSGLGLVLSSTHAGQYGSHDEHVNMTHYTSTIATARHVATGMSNALPIMDLTSGTGCS